MLSEEEQLYQENVMDHYRNPRNKRTCSHASTSARELNPLCGDTIELFIQFEKEESGKTIAKELCFQGDGCAISQAAVSLLTEELQGKTLEKLKSFNSEEVYELLGIPISHTRQKCALLCLKALKAALIQYENQQKR